MQNSNTVTDTIINRRTIHEFKEGECPELSVIQTALDAARWAPNHYLTEPWRVYLLGEETRTAICQLNAELVRKRKGDDAAEAKLRRWSKQPGWMVVTCNLSSDPITHLEDYASCCCFIQNLSLVLWEQGIGMKWSSGDVIRDSQMYDICWIDETAEKIVGVFWYGYPAEIPTVSRKTAEHFTTTLP